ncbi:MAG TPA: putative phosphothreonine lyase domain-containing protein [Planctomycetota bacterium]|nr:putative phosphothreonine lyase domain-containing protein [Planctomycetota bacterium]
MRANRDGPRLSDADADPSTFADAFWLTADRQVGTYPPPTPRSGKWLVFVPEARVDEMWATIKQATRDGELGSSAKVTTARPSSNARSAGTRVICVHTYDFEDEADVMRVRAALRELGVRARIPYKADRDTFAGRYSNRGDRGIAKHFA